MLKELIHICQQCGQDNVPLLSAHWESGAGHLCVGCCASLVETNNVRVYYFTKVANNEATADLRLLNSSKSARLYYKLTGELERADA